MTSDHFLAFLLLFCLPMSPLVVGPILFRLTSLRDMSAIYPLAVDGKLHLFSCPVCSAHSTYNAWSVRRDFWTNQPKPASERLQWRCHVCGTRHVEAWPTTKTLDVKPQSVTARYEPQGVQP